MRFNLYHVAYHSGFFLKQRIILLTEFRVLANEKIKHSIASYVGCIDFSINWALYTIKQLVGVQAIALVSRLKNNENYFIAKQTFAENDKGL